MPVYNMNWTQNVTSVLDIFTGINTAVSTRANPYFDTYILGYLIMVSFFIIFMIVNNRYDFNESLIINLFLTTILAVLLFIVGLVNVAAIIYPFVIFCLLLIWYMLTGRT